MSPATHLSTRLAVKPKRGLLAMAVAGAVDYGMDKTMLTGLRDRRDLVAMILVDSAGWVVDATATIVAVARDRATIVTLMETGDSGVGPVVVVVIVGAEALMTTTHTTAPLLLQMPCLTSRGRI